MKRVISSNNTSRGDGSSKVKCFRSSRPLQGEEVPADEMSVDYYSNIVQSKEKASSKSFGNSARKSMNDTSFEVNLKVVASTTRGSRISFSSPSSSTSNCNKEDNYKSNSSPPTEEKDAVTTLNKNHNISVLLENK